MFEYKIRFKRITLGVVKSKHYCRILFKINQLHNNKNGK